MIPTNRVSKQRQTTDFVASGVTAPVEIIRHDGAGNDQPRVLHVWGSRGQYNVARPFIQGILSQECNGVNRTEPLQIPWSGLAVQLTPGLTVLRLLVASGGPPLGPNDYIYATIAPGYAAEGHRMAFRVDAVNPSVTFDAEDPSLGCLFATALELSGHGEPAPGLSPYTVQYDGGFVIIAGTVNQTLKVDWRSKVIVNINAGCAVNASWRFFR